MNHAAVIRQFLRERRGEEFVAESFPFVTISREAGAGGHTLARDILRKLEIVQPGAFSEEWEVFDHKLCAMICSNWPIIRRCMRFGMIQTTTRRRCFMRVRCWISPIPPPGPGMRARFPPFRRMRICGRMARTMIAAIG